LFNVYAYYLYKNDLTGTGFLGNVNAGGSGTGGATATTPATFADHPWWLGFGGGLRPGNWELSGQFIYNGGKRDWNSGFKGPNGITEADYQAWTAELLAKYRIGPGLAVALEGFYMTGNDTDNKTNIKEFTMPTMTEATYGFGNDRSVFFYYNSDFMYYWGATLYPQGTWYLRANTEYNPHPRVNLNFNYLYIGNTASGTYGGESPLYETNVNLNNLPSTRVVGRFDMSKPYVGSEINGIARLKIYDTLGFNVGFGYFFPGDVFNTPTQSASNAWALLTRLRFVF